MTTSDYDTQDPRGPEGESSRHVDCHAEERADGTIPCGMCLDSGMWTEEDAAPAVTMIRRDDGLYPLCEECAGQWESL